MKRRFARTDQNHGQIVKALREVGCSVQSLAAVGSGCPDLLIARNGKLWLMEVKNPKMPPSRRGLTLDEKVWHMRWNSPVHVVNSADEALEVVK